MFGTFANASFSRWTFRRSSTDNSTIRNDFTAWKDLLWISSYRCYCGFSNERSSTYIGLVAFDSWIEKRELPCKLSTDFYSQYIFSQLFSIHLCFLLGIVNKSSVHSLTFQTVTCQLYLFAGVLRAWECGGGGTDPSLSLSCSSGGSTHICR